MTSGQESPPGRPGSTAKGRLSVMVATVAGLLLLVLLVAGTAIGAPGARQLLVTTVLLAGLIAAGTRLHRR